jgi:hypothetical protein
MEEPKDKLADEDLDQPVKINGEEEVEGEEKRLIHTSHAAPMLLPYHTVPLRV